MKSLIIFRFSLNHNEGKEKKTKNYLKKSKERKGKREKMCDRRPQHKYNDLLHKEYVTITIIYDVVLLSLLHTSPLPIFIFRLTPCYLLHALPFFSTKHHHFTVTIYFQLNSNHFYFGCRLPHFRSRSYINGPYTRMPNFQYGAFNISFFFEPNLLPLFQR